MSIALSRSASKFSDEQATRYAVYAFMVCMPWATVFLDSLNPHDSARMLQSVVMCLAAWAMVRHGGPWVPMVPRKRMALFGLLAIGSLSVCVAERWTYASLEASAAVLLVLVAAVIARTPMQILLRELPAVIAFSALMSLVMELPRLTFFLADGRVPQAADFGFMYMSHRFLNHAQSLILPFAFLPLLVRTTRWVRIAAWIGVIGGLALLWRTGGRGTLIAVAVFALALPCLLRFQAKQIVRVLALALLGAVLVYFACFVLPAVLLGLPQDHRGNATLRLIGSDDSGRIYLWKLALNDAMQNPWLGIGPMHYAHQPNLLAAHPHNSVLQVAAEWGMPMTVGILATLVALFVRTAGKVLTTEAGSDARVLLAVSWSATLVGLVDSLVSGTLVMPVSQMWWTVALGCMLAQPVKGAPHVPIAGLRIRWLLVSALVAVHLATSAMTYQSVGTASRRHCTGACS